MRHQKSRDILSAEPKVGTQALRKLLGVVVRVVEVPLELVNQARGADVKVQLRRRKKTARK